MGKIKHRDDRLKIKLPSNYENQGCSSEQFPWFSFRYMTDNKKHSLKFLDSLGRSEREKTLLSLYMKLTHIREIIAEEFLE